MPSTSSTSSWRSSTTAGRTARGSPASSSAPRPARSICFVSGPLGRAPSRRSSRRSTANIATSLPSASPIRLTPRPVCPSPANSTWAICVTAPPAGRASLTSTPSCAAAIGAPATWPSAATSTSRTRTTSSPRSAPPGSTPASMPTRILSSSKWAICSTRRPTACADSSKSTRGARGWR